MRCPICSGPMAPLFSSMFCPNDCDRVRLAFEFIDLPSGGGQAPVRWMMAVVPKDAKSIPKWATRGWNLHAGTESPRSDARLSLIQLRDAWSTWPDSPGWEIMDRTVGGRDFIRGSDDYLVFGPAV